MNGWEFFKIDYFFVCNNHKQISFSIVSVCSLLFTEKWDQLYWVKAYNQLLLGSKVWILFSIHMDNIITMYSVRKYKLCAQAWEKWRNANLSGLCRRGSNKYYFLLTMYNVYFKMSKGSKQLTYFLEKSIVLIIFECFFHHRHAYIVNLSYRCSTWMRYQQSYIVVSDRIYQNNIQSFAVATMRLLFFEI